MSENTTQYLGDGLYVDYDGWMVTLGTQEGMRVYLEPDVLISLIEFLKGKNLIVMRDPDWEPEDPNRLPKD